MKKLFYLLPILSMAFVVGCAGKKEEEKANTINLAKALNELTELKVSDLGKTIRYVPLETTDDILIGNNPDVKVVNDKVVVTTSKQCQVFNKNNGKFIAQIGHIGEDPEGYSSTKCWVDEDNELLYFYRKPQQLICYDALGNFKGKIELQGKNTPTDFTFIDSLIIGGFNNYLMNNVGNNSLAVYNLNGEMLDSIPGNTGIGMKDIVSLSVLKNVSLYGIWAKNGLMLIDYTDNRKVATSPDAGIVWKTGNEIRFKEEFTDTVYTWKGDALEHYITFDTGSWHWPVNERTDANNSNRRLVVSYVNETANQIFFQCIQGLFDGPVVYNGLYDKSSGETLLAKHKDGIEDDLTHFLPVKIHTISSMDEYVGIIESTDALEWLEEHPEASSQKNLEFLKNLSEDMNPVVVLIK